MEEDGPAKGVTDGNGTPENIDFFGIKVEDFGVRKGNDTERLVNLVEIDLVLCNAGVFECLGDRQGRRHREQKRFLRITKRPRKFGGKEGGCVEEGKEGGST